MDTEHTIKWLKSAAEYFEREQPNATTRWQAEQHQERAKACNEALVQIEGKALARKVLDTPSPKSEWPACGCRSRCSEC